MWGLFLDTTSNIAKFAATITEDPSYHPNEAEEGCDTFPPYFAIPTTDIFSDNPLHYGR